MKINLPIIILLSSVLLATKLAAIEFSFSELDSDEGYVLLGVPKNFQFHSIQIKGEDSVKVTKEHLAKRNEYVILRMDEGDYYFKSLNLARNYGYKLDRDYWSFSVRPGVVNYIGNLTFERFDLSSNVRFELKNSSSITVNYVLYNYRSVLENQKLSYSGPGKDNFIHYFQKNISIEAFE